MMLLTDEQIKRLVNHKPITQLPPWSSNNRDETNQFIRDCIVQLCKKEELLEKTEFDDYGSGFASFVDCWLYRPEPEFAAKSPASDSVAYIGLTILFCRLTNLFVMFEGQKSWGPEVSSSYMPDFEKVDEFNSDVIRTLAERVEIQLIEMGWTRAFKKDLAYPLPDQMQAPTILEVDHHRHFDALFNWMD